MGGAVEEVSRSKEGTLTWKLGDPIKQENQRLSQRKTQVIKKVNSALTQKIKAHTTQAWAVRSVETRVRQWLGILKWQVLDTWWGAPLRKVPRISLLLQCSPMQGVWCERTQWSWHTGAALCGHILSLWFAMNGMVSTSTSPNCKSSCLQLAAQAHCCSHLALVSSSTEQTHIQTPWRPRPYTKSENHRQDGGCNSPVKHLEMGWDHSRTKSQLKTANEDLSAMAV